MKHFFQKNDNGVFVELTETEVIRQWNKFCEDNPLYEDIEVVEMTEFNKCNFDDVKISKAGFNNQDKYFTYNSHFDAIFSFNNIEERIGVNLLNLVVLNDDDLSFVARDADNKLHLFFGGIPYKDTSRNAWVTNSKEIRVVEIPSQFFPCICWVDKNPNLLIDEKIDEH